MSLARSTPSQQAVDAAGLLAFLDDVRDGALGLHGLMVARHGHVIAEGWWAPYDPERVHLVYSCSKSFTATAVGLLVDSGRLSLEDQVLDRLPWWLLSTSWDEISDRWKRATIAHLLSMTLGHDDDAWGSAMAGAVDENGIPTGTDWIDLILRSDLDHEPGTTFSYNQVCTYLLSRIVTHASGQPLLEFLRSRLFDPLGIPPTGTHTDTAGNALGFTGLHVTTESLLNLAQLYLDDGSWNGEQLLSQGWVRRAREPFGPPNRDPLANPDWAQGYGFSFWNARHGYRGDGAYGQYAIVVPEQDLAIGITAETPDMRHTLDALWEHVLPACDRPGSAEADAQLADRLATLGFDPSVVSPGAVCEPLPAHWRVVSCEPADGSRTSADGWSLEVEGTGGRHRLLASERDWTPHEWTYDGGGLPLLARATRRGSGVDVDVLVIETPHRFRVTVGQDGAGELAWHSMPLMGADPFGLLLTVRES